MKTTQINPCLKYAVVLGSAVFLGSQAYATPAANNTPEIKKPEAKTNPEPLVNADNLILSVAAADWNADKKPDSAALLRAGDQADLYLYLNNGKGGLELKLVKKALVWTGALAGTLPQLSTAKGGVLFIDSQNEAIGRNRWSQRLTIDYRDNDFLVTGYSYNERDTLEPNTSSSCDVNLLTGKGIKNKKAFKIDGQKIKLSDWADEKAPKECRN